MTRPDPTPDRDVGRDFAAPYRPLSGRQRAAIVVLAIVTAVGVILLLLYPPGGVVRHRPPAPGIPDCAASAGSDASDCVGGKASVIVTTPAPSR